MGSNPTPTIFAQVVERLRHMSDKHDLEGSTPSLCILFLLSWSNGL